MGSKVVVIYLSYDISDDKLRYKFSKFISKYGHRVQYSVFEIDNSATILNNLIVQIKNKFEKQFKQSDSILILKLSSTCEIIRFGNAKNEESDIILV